MLRIMLAPPKCHLALSLSAGGIPLVVCTPRRLTRAVMKQYKRAYSESKETIAVLLLNNTRGAMANSFWRRSKPESSALDGLW